MGTSFNPELISNASHRLNYMYIRSNSYDVQLFCWPVTLLSPAYSIISPVHPIASKFRLYIHVHVCVKSSGCLTCTLHVSLKHTILLWSANKVRDSTTTMACTCTLYVFCYIHVHIHLHCVMPLCVRVWYMVIARNISKSVKQVCLQ